MQLVNPYLFGDSFNGFQRLELGGQTTASTKTIPSKYRHIIMRGEVRSNDTVATPAGMEIILNGDTGANYSAQRTWGSGTNVLNDSLVGRNALGFFDAPISTDTANLATHFEIIIPLANGTDFNTVGTFKLLYHFGTATTEQRPIWGGFSWQSTDRVTKITVTEDNGSTFATNSFVDVYGIE